MLLPAAAAPEVELSSDGGLSLTVVPGCLDEMRRGVISAAAELVKALVVGDRHELAPRDAEEHRDRKEITLKYN